MPNPPRTRRRSHSGSGGSSIGSASTASSSSRSSTSSAERRRRAQTANLKRQNLPRLRHRQQGPSASGASTRSKRGGRPGAGAGAGAAAGGGGGAGTQTPAALDPLPYTGPRRLSYIPESSAEWDDVENSSHDDEGSMDTDDMEARLEELEAEARRSSDVGLEDDGNDHDKEKERRNRPADRKQQQQQHTSISARSDLDVPLEESLDDFLRRKSRLSQSRRHSKTNSEVADGADVSGVWSNVAHEFGSGSGQGGSRRRRASTGSKEGSLPSLDRTEHTGNTSGRSLEYSWSAGTHKGASGDGRWNSRGSSSKGRPMPRRSGSGTEHSTTDSWGAPRVDDGDDDGQKGHNGAADAAAAANDDRPHARLHRLSTGNLSCDTWDSSSRISYGGDSFAAENEDGADGEGGDQNDDGGDGAQHSMVKRGVVAGNDEDYDHRSSISTNESAHRTAVVVAATAVATATVADTMADGSQMNLGGADAAAGLGSSDHGGPVPVVGGDYMIGLNDVVDTSDDRLGGFSCEGTDDNNEDEDGDSVDDDGRPHLNPHDRLHHMSNDALSCDTSGWDSKDFDNIDEMGLGDNHADEENQGQQEADGRRQPHNRLHHMSIDDMSVASGSQASHSYDSRAANATRDENRVCMSGGDDQSAAAQSTSAASWASMSRTARSIVNDVVKSFKGTGAGAAALASSVPEQKHGKSPDVGIYEEEYLDDEEAYGDGAVGMGYGENYDLDGNGLSQEKRSVKQHPEQRASRPDNYGAERLHRMSMDTIDADDLSSATPLSAQGTAQQSAIQLDPSGSVSYYEHDVAMSPETKGSTPTNLFKSLGESVRRLAAKSSVRKESRDKVTPTPQQDFEDYRHEDDGGYDGYDGYDGHSHGEASYNEMENSTKPPRSKRESWFAYIYHHMWYFLLGTCLLLGTIILVVFLVRRDSGGSDNAVDTASQGDSNSQFETKDDNSPSISRTPEEVRRKETIQAKLVEMGISDISAFDHASSPQKAALEWLSFDDEAQLEANDQYLSSRYSLAVFYLSADLAKNEERRQQDLFEAPGASNQWVESSNWLSSAGFCSWSGIECVPQWNNPEETKFDGDGEITHFVLPSNNIHASLPAELFSAFGKSLRVLDLSNNRLTSSIPDEINQLAKIETLDLSRNSLTRRMPNVSSLQALQNLRLGSNELSGEISSLEDLEALVAIDLQSNDFTGEFDLTKFHRAINLKEIRVNDNDGLTGVLPYQFGFFGFMSRVEILDLSGNSFDGTIPRAIKNMKGLVELNISGNRLTGELPDALGGLYEMEVLDVSDNQFEGISMPSTVCELKDNHNLNKLVADCRDDFGGGMNAKVFCPCCTDCV